MLTGIGLLLGYWLLALVLMFVAGTVVAVVTESSVAAVERTVVLLGVVDLLLALAAVARFAAATARFAAGLGRAIWIGVFVIGLGFLTAAVFVITAFNR